MKPPAPRLGRPRTRDAHAGQWPDVHAGAFAPPASPTRAGHPAPLPARKLASSALFYPAATIYAILALPASVLSMLGLGARLPGLAAPAQHAHEMLFGFALAVVMGNQGGAVSARRLVLAFALWLAARIGFLLAPQSLPSFLANTGFALLLALTLVPRLASAVKKLRNVTLPAALAAICLSAIAVQVLLRIDKAATQQHAFEIAILLFALLMFFMGGRILTAAVAGQFHHQGQVLDKRVQPHLEAVVVVLIGLALALQFVRHTALTATAASTAMLAAGALCALRLLRWRLWALRGRPDLLCLAAGYGWLAAGLVLLGAAGWGMLNLTSAMHAITVGSLGTLTLNVMAMSWVLKARVDPSRAGLQLAGTVLLSAAALARILAGEGLGDARQLLLFAAGCWSGAFALLLALFLRVRALASRKLRPLPHA